MVFVTFWLKLVFFFFAWFLGASWSPKRYIITKSLKNKWFFNDFPQILEKPIVFQ